jgi:cytochrome c2
MLTGCRGGRQLPGYAVRTGGNAERGRQVVAEKSCGACHEIPRIVGAWGVVGPSLAEVARRSEIGGLPNTPENLARWIRAPETLEPRTVMPNVGLDERDARDVTAFLYSLREDMP